MLGILKELIHLGDDLIIGDEVADIVIAVLILGKRGKSLADYLLLLLLGESLLIGDDILDKRLIRLILTNLGDNVAREHGKGVELFKGCGGILTEL